MGLLWVILWVVLSVIRESLAGQCELLWLYDGLFLLYDGLFWLYVIRANARIHACVGYSHIWAHHVVYTPISPPSPTSFCRLSMGTMSKLFVERVFERFSKSMQGRLVMDLYGFVDFMLAWDGRATVQGMAVLFPVFDLDNKGYLNEVCWVCWGMSSSDEGCVQPLEGTLMDVQTVKPTRRNNTPFHKTLSKADLYTFLREIHELWLSFGQTADLQLMDMVADVVDIVRPRDRQQIRATDILRCGMPATLVGMLADVNTFWEYENRESLQQQQQQDAQGGDDLEVV